VRAVTEQQTDIGNHHEEEHSVRPSNRFIATASLTAFVVSAFVANNYTHAQKQKQAAKPAAAPAAVEAAADRYSAISGHMSFTADVVQTQPDLIVAVLDLDLWYGRRAGPLPGNAGVAVEVVVYAPGDERCRGDRIASFTGQAREIVPMDVPVKDRAVVTIEVPPSAAPYNVVVRLIGGPVRGGPVGVISKNAAKLLPEVRPQVFSAERRTAKLGF
jgi:hypothetical protein